MKNTATIKNLVVIFVLFLTAFSFSFRVSAIAPNEDDPFKDFIALIDAYEGFIVSVNPEKSEFLLSVSCTKIDKWSSMCAEANPSRWQLWLRFVNLFRDPTHIKVSTNNATQFKSYDTHIPANFSGLKENTFVGIKGDLSGRGLLGFGGREIVANEIIIPQMQSWSGRLSSMENKILDLKSESGFDIKTYINENTLIVDEDDNKISLNNLFLNDDILSVWGRRYEIEWGEGIKEIKKVELVAEKVILLGKATGEGEQIKTILGKPETIDLGGGVSVPNIIGELFCKEGLKRIEVRFGTGPDSTQKFYCTNCGDHICKSPEIESNCPQDCAKLLLNPGDKFDYSVAIDKKTFDLAKGIFYGNITISGTKLIDLKFITDNNTEFYRTTGEQWKEKADISVLREYIDSFGPKSIRIKGVILPSEKVELNVDVNEVLMFVQ